LKADVIPLVLGALVFFSSLISLKLGLSVAIIEILLGTAAGWSLQASLIAGTALSTASLAVVYSVLVETGLSKTAIGKLRMASTGTDRAH